MPVEKKQRTYDKEERKDKRDFKQKKKRVCQFCTKGSAAISYKDEKVLSKFISERGKILPRRVTGTCAKHQREIVNAINRARHVGILPYVIK